MHHYKITEEEFQSETTKEIKLDLKPANKSPSEVPKVPPKAFKQPSLPDISPNNIIR
jgi:hypothetical protein